MQAATKILSYEDSADLIAESQAEHALDLGSSILYVLQHPVHGRLAVINSAVGACGFIRL